MANNDHLREDRAAFNMRGLDRPMQWPQTSATDEYRAKIFKSGNSLSLRLPKALGLTEGTEMVLRLEQDGRYSFEPAARPKRKFNIDKVWGCAIGSGLKPIKSEDRIFEERPLLWDDPEWRAKYLPSE